MLELLLLILSSGQPVKTKSVNDKHFPENSSHAAEEIGNLNFSSNIGSRSISGSRTRKRLKKRIYSITKQIYSNIFPDHPSIPSNSPQIPLGIPNKKRQFLLSITGLFLKWNCAKSLSFPPLSFLKLIRKIKSTDHSNTHHHHFFNRAIVFLQPAN